MHRNTSLTGGGQPAHRPDGVGQLAAGGGEQFLADTVGELRPPLAPPPQSISPPIRISAR
ncbi:hypothetical protein [Streptomyces hokutonensis]|uniref:hypothetical protein n=1 Tax=Streptomyces hokutonensis TaxID=1306990 RepID=UPI00381CFFB0